MRRSELIALICAILISVGALFFGRYVAESLEEDARAGAESALSVLGASGLTLDVDGIVVRVSGQVRSEAEADAIRTALEGANGVGGVQDDMVPVPPLVDLRPSILRLQKDALAITLSGEAPSLEARDLLSARVEMTRGELEFFNVMKAQSRLASDAWLNAAEVVIDAVRELRVGQAVVEPNFVRIIGATSDAQVRATMRKRLQERLGPDFRIDLDISSPPPMLSPYVFELRKTSEGLTPGACAAPSASVRSAILGAMKSAGVKAQLRVCDIANGAPNERWYDAVARAIGALDAVEEGEVRIVDDQIRAEGYVPTPEKIAAARDRIAADWPEDYKIDARVSVTLPIVRPYTLLAVKRPGQNRISGHAPTRAAAEAWAGQLKAENQLKLARGAPPEWENAAGVVINALAELKFGAATLTDSSFLLAAPGDPAQRDKLRQRLLSQLPDNYDLKVHEAHAPRLLFYSEKRPDPNGRPNLSSFSFVARKNVDGVAELSGVVGSEISKSTVASFARAKLGGEDLSENLAVGETEAPLGWERALFAALDALGGLSHGEIVAEPGALYLRGEAFDANQARAALMVLDAKAPEDFTKFTRVTIYERLPENNAPPPSKRLPPEECVNKMNAQVSKDPIVFGSGSSEIDPVSSKRIDSLAALLRSCPSARIEIGGHTDSVGSERGNLSLSRSRAAAVRLAFTARGVPPDRVMAHGYGESAPIADNETEAGRAKNRRIEFRLRN